jgi:hypothetical protein
VAAVKRLLLAFALVALGLAAVALTGAHSSAAATRPAARSLHVVALGDGLIGGRRFLGRTPAQVTAAFGKPAARTAGRTSLDLRYGAWTLRFERRRSDGTLIASSARSVDSALYGSRGRRLLAPWFGRAGIEGAVTSELGWTADGYFNEWIRRDGRFVGADFPRTITWGIDARGRRWLKLETDLDFEFRG